MAEAVWSSELLEVAWAELPAAELAAAEPVVAELAVAELVPPGLARMSRIAVPPVPW